MKIAMGMAPIAPGHYKSIIKYSAYDSNEVKRPNPACLEITGDLS